MNLSFTAACFLPMISNLKMEKSFILISLIILIRILSHNHVYTKAKKIDKKEL